jgi:hypothetical protein
MSQDVAPSSSAERMRRSRERRREGRLCLPAFELRRSTRHTLVELGWLEATQQDDVAAVEHAFRRFAARALAVARNRKFQGLFVPEVSSSM